MEVYSRRILVEDFFFECEIKDWVVVEDPFTLDFVIKIT